jgi:hypothetical protein
MSLRLDGLQSKQTSKSKLGIFPVMIASGSDITRSAVGRLQSESICLPTDKTHRPGLKTLIFPGLTHGLRISVPIDASVAISKSCFLKG